MDALELLHDDHEAMLELFYRLDHSDDDARQLSHSLATLVEAHLSAERKVLFPRLSRARECQPLLKEACRQEAQIARVLREWRDLPTENARWELLYQELKDWVRWHIDGEEDALFKKMRKLLSQAEMDELGESLQVEKEAA